jgi:hypothetical protein
MGHLRDQEIVQSTGKKKQFFLSQKNCFQFVPKTVAPPIGGENLAP